MSSDPIKPKIGLRFVLEHLRELWTLMQSNKEYVQSEITQTQHLSTALPPYPEGILGPMDEGMIYLLFNSCGESQSPLEFDSVYRVFWVSAPDLKYHQLDAFLISERLGNKHWARFFDTPIFTSDFPNRFHQEINIDQFQMTMDGEWGSGYHLELHDSRLNIQGTLDYHAISSQYSLVYYNGKSISSPRLLEQFYDTFGFQVSGEIGLEGQIHNVTGARGIFEHGVGIFSTLDILEWRWLNIQFPKGAAHLFYHPLCLPDGQRIEAGEAAMVYDGQWHHFLCGDFSIIPLQDQYDESLRRRIPIRWHVTAQDPVHKTNILDLVITDIQHCSWVTNIPDYDTDYITDYLIDAQGTWKDEPIKGRGTMEYLTH